MKRDLKINYSVLSSVVNNLKQYKENVESIDGILKSINEKLENENDGKAIKALEGKYDKIKSQIDSCKEEVSDLYDIFNNYINDMTSIIKPIDDKEVMRVSRNDIYWNKWSISRACDKVGSMMESPLLALETLGVAGNNRLKLKSNCETIYAIY